MKRLSPRHVITAVGVLAIVLLDRTGGSSHAVSRLDPGPDGRSNILVIVLDDIGIDQWGIEPFGWTGVGGAESPNLPVLQSIADQGVSFTNFWATPECSPTRASFLTGRYSFRTGVVTAITDGMVCPQQLNPAELTVPKLLGPTGYATAMIGKYHLAGEPGSVPPGLGYEAPALSAGLDYYEGYWSLPPLLDATVGGQADADSPLTTCGAPISLEGIGAACFPPDGTSPEAYCVEGLNPFDALAMGGIPLLTPAGSLAEECHLAACSSVDFELENAYYAWPKTTTFSSGRYSQTPEEDPWREYLTSFISRRSAEWIGAHVDSPRPWLCFVTHSAAHTPIQPPPQAMIDVDNFAPECEVPIAPFGSGGFRAQFRLMVEAVDRSIGDMLVELDLATRDGETVTLRDPAVTNTTIIVLNDNGSLGSTVNPPFSARAAKQTVYQTGIWNPLIVVGPMVAEPGSVVDEIVNCVDLFGLMCDIAGVDWRAEIPTTRKVDSHPMMHYLDPSVPGEPRSYDFGIFSHGIFEEGGVGACVIGQSCVDNLITGEGLCSANGGCWLSGDGPPYDTSIASFCAFYDQDPDDPYKGTCVQGCDDVTYCFVPIAAEPYYCDKCADGSDPILVAPTAAGQWAARRGRWKLLVQLLPDCVPDDVECTIGLYHLGTPEAPLHAGIEESIDTLRWNPLAEDEELPPVAQAAYDDLRTYMYGLLLTEWYCPGDGNKDNAVDGADIGGVLGYWGAPSFWDANLDGTTDGADLAIVLANWAADCTGQVNPAGQGIPDCLEPAIGR